MNTTLKVKLIEEQVELDASRKGLHTFGAVVGYLRTHHSAANCFFAYSAKYEQLQPDLKVHNLLSQRSLVRALVTNDTRRYSTR